MGVAERGEHPAGWRAGPCIQAVLGPGGRSLLVLQPPRAKHQSLLKVFSLKSSQQGLEGGSTLLTGHREVKEHVQGQPARRYWSQAGSGSCYNSVPHPPNHPGRHSGTQLVLQDRKSPPSPIPLSLSRKQRGSNGPCTTLPCGHSHRGRRCRA